jgi:ribosomal protein S18 acetylase RimI-like enzyme
VIRPARSDELAALAAAVAPQELLVRYEIGAARLAELLGEAIARGEPVIVAEQSGELRGFAWYLRTGTFGAGGYLRLIALVPGQEGRGVGGTLLDAVEADVAAHARQLFLLVSHWNEGARRFYARRGYVEVGRLPAWVRPDTDEIICWKRL